MTLLPVFPPSPVCLCVVLVCGRSFASFWQLAISTLFYPSSSSTAERWSSFHSSADYSACFCANNSAFSSLRVIPLVFTGLLVFKSLLTPVFRWPEPAPRVSTTFSSSSVVFKPFSPNPHPSSPTTSLPLAHSCSPFLPPLSWVGMKVRGGVEVVALSHTVCTTIYDAKLS